MPFTPTSDLPPDPTVRVFFNGLMIMKPSADNRRCEVYIHRSAPNHHLSIEIRQKRPQKPDVILMRHLGPLAFALPTPGSPSGSPPIHGFLVFGETPQGVKRYLGVPGPMGERSLLDAFNFNQFHAGKTDIDPLGARPSLYFDDGTFYSAEITSPDVKVRLKKGDTVVHEFPQLAALIGANLYNHKVFVQWRQEGILRTLPLKRQPGISYEIYVSNDPLFEAPPELGTPSHDELREYYKILPRVPGPEQYELHFEYPPTPTELVTAKRDDKGSTMIPCMPGIDDP